MVLDSEINEGVEGQSHTKSGKVRFLCSIFSLSLCPLRYKAIFLFIVRGAKWIHAFFPIFAPFVLSVSTSRLGAARRGCQDVNSRVHSSIAHWNVPTLLSGARVFRTSHIAKKKTRLEVQGTPL